MNGATVGETRAIVVREGRAGVELETLALAAPAAGEVLVALHSVGVCHTDFSVARGLLPIMRLPGVPGHEGAGVVERVGAGVTHVAPGDRVMVSSIAPCGLCVRCQRGEGAYCEREGARHGVMPDGTTRLHDRDGQPVYVGFNSGLFADRAVLAASAVVPVPEGVSLDVAALLGCAVVSGYGAVVNTARVRPGDSVLVMGCGGVGMSAVMAARLVGADTIVASDPNPARRAIALEVGATQAIDPTVPGAADEIAAVARGGFGTVIEASGNPIAIASVFDLLERGGTGVFVGAPPPAEQLTVSVLALAASGKRLTGCLTGEVSPAVDLPVLARLQRDGRLPLDRLVTDHMPLERASEALAQFERGDGLRTILTFA